MKKSEELWKESQQAESDFKSLTLGEKAIREGRNERFEEEWLEKLRDKLGMTMTYIDSMHCWRIFFDKDKIDFYPKANKIFIYGKNTWVKPGLKWLINKFLK